MAENSNISWCHHTFNGWIGCNKTDPGCAHCYAKALMDDYLGRAKWGPEGVGTRIKTSPFNWKKPLLWNKKAGEKGVRERVFSASLSDVFEDWQGPILDHKGNLLSVRDDFYELGEKTPRAMTMNDLRRDLFKLIDDTPNLDWLLLTKDPQNIAKMMPPYTWHSCVSGDCDHQTQAECNEALSHPDSKARDNVWLGTSISEQESADKEIPELLKCRDLAPVLFASAEPLLGPIDLMGCLPFEDDLGAERGLDWVIGGGESGPKRREMPLDAFTSLADQCIAADTAFFAKQDNGLKPGERGRIPGPYWIHQFPTPRTA